MILKIKFDGIFDLDKTFNCGQCFRWYKKDDFWCGVVSGYFVKCKIENNFLIIDSSLSDMNFWKNYFDLNLNYSSIITEIKGIDKFIAKTISENVGIRILRQDAWEVVCSFIISQNNNIQRIKHIISNLCKNFGDLNGESYSFPNALKLSHLSIDDLSMIKAGFRAKYILDASKRISSGEIDFSEIQKLNVSDSLKILQKIHGVGPKVASCILLYGFHKLDSFPIDTWMKKVISKFYKNVNQDYFGKYAGIVQQYLFLWSRNHPEIFK